MKSVFSSIICLLLALTVSAQHFSTNLYFEDKDGNKDTIIIGYDDISSPIFDSIFNPANQQDAEQIVNSIEDGTAWAWVRWATLVGIIPIEYPHFVRSLFLPTPNPNDEELVYYGGDLLIPADRLPVIIRWDKSLFAEPERAGTRITDLYAVDYTCGYECLDHDTFMSEHDSIIVYASCGEEIDNALNATMCSLERVNPHTFQPSEYADIYMKRLLLGFAYRTKQSIEDIPANTHITKMIQNGQLYIRYDDSWFNMYGIKYNQ